VLYVAYSNGCGYTEFKILISILSQQVLFTLITSFVKGGSDQQHRKTGGSSLYLKPLHDFVEKVSEAISNILDVDVVITNSNYERVGNTFAYPGEPTPIRKMSVTGQILETGKPVVMDSKESYSGCKDCPDIETCSISAMVGVPILFHDKVVGAIALIIPQHKKIKIFNNLNNAISFLENMADLLSGKIQNNYDYLRLNQIRREREILMDYLGDAIATTDEQGNITYSNQTFRNIFAGGAAALPGTITECVNHPFVRESLEQHRSCSDKLFYYKANGRDFYGFANCQHLMWDGLSQGMLFYFRDIRSVSDLSHPKRQAGITFSRFTCQEDKGMKLLVSEAKSLAIGSEIITILGEPGTNKNALARAIHNFSDRSSNLFTQVDCRDMMLEEREDEIFGSVDGNNLVESLGKLWLAYRGTIYFSDIDALPIFLQNQLVDFIKTGAIRLSHQSDIPADTRILFSSSKDLKALTAEGMFSEGLYYRIYKNVLELPPLRERPSDVEYLFRTYTTFFSKRIAGREIAVLPETVARLLRYSWPGNSAELYKMAERAVLNAVGGEITPECLALPEDLFTPQEAPQSIDQMERSHIIGLLEKQKSKKEIANILGISRATLYRKIKKYGLSDDASPDQY